MGCGPVQPPSSAQTKWADDSGTFEQLHSINHPPPGAQRLPLPAQVRSPGPTAAEPGQGQEGRRQWAGREPQSGFQGPPLVTTLLPGPGSRGMLAPCSQAGWAMGRGCWPRLFSWWAQCTALAWASQTARRPQFPCEVVHRWDPLWGEATGLLVHRDTYKQPREPSSSALQREAPGLHLGPGGVTWASGCSSLSLSSPVGEGSAVADRTGIGLPAPWKVGATASPSGTAATSRDAAGPSPNPSLASLSCSCHTHPADSDATGFCSQIQPGRNLLSPGSWATQPWSPCMDPGPLKVVAGCTPLAPRLAPSLQNQSFAPLRPRLKRSHSANEPTPHSANTPTSSVSPGRRR